MQVPITCACVHNQLGENLIILIFFDTEFTKLHISSMLIFIGLIFKDGQEFYVEITAICNLRLEGPNFLANTIHLGYLQHGWNNQIRTDYPRTAAG